MAGLTSHLEEMEEGQRKGRDTAAALRLAQSEFAKLKPAQLRASNAVLTSNSQRSSGGTESPLRRGTDVRTPGRRLQIS